MKPALRELTRRAVIGTALLGVMVAAASGTPDIGASRGAPDPTLEVPAARGSSAVKATAQVIRG